MTGWAAILAFAERDSAALAAAFRQPAQQQGEFLLSLLRENDRTAFGVEHGFDGIRDLASFRRAVPVRSHADIERWIARIAAGERNVLTRDTVVAFEETSGTTSGAKLIPYTERSLYAFRAAILPWLAGLAQRRPAITRGLVYLAASPVNREPRVLPCGLPVGLPSEGAYLGAEIGASLGSLLVPQPGAPSRDIDAWRANTLTALMKCRTLTFISIWSPTFLLELLEALPGGLDTRALWPQLDTISMWTDGASAPFARRVAERFPGIHIDAKGVLATESAVTLRIDDAPGCVPALTSAFIEFADEQGECRLAHELDAGAVYRIVITTPGGLYRYDTGDELRCIGFREGVPRLQFVGRAGLMSDLVGEKLTEGFVSSALADISRPVSLVPNDTPHPHYELWVDAPDAGDGEAFASSIDERLRRNVQYAYARDLGQLRAPVTIFRPGFVQHRRHVLVARGQRLGDVKPSALILDRSTLP